MKLAGICLLGIYAFIRFLPFLITFLFTIRKKIPVVIGVILNAVAFLGMHYYHYRDFTILGYVKNVGGLNFYHTDVEYFTISAAAAIWIAVLLGILLRILFYENSERVLPKWQQCTSMAVVSISFLLIIAGFEVRGYFNSQIVIHEICSNNESYIIDGNEQVADYIELYNAGELPCQISGLYLSDDEYHLQKMSLDGYVLPSGGIVVIPCVDEMNSFPISSDGEDIYLSNETGEILEHVRVSELENDMAYSKTDIEKNIWEVTDCTPGSVYSQKEFVLVEAPVLSRASGFYDTEFDLEINSSEDTIIYYTLDGSIPDEGSSLYESSIRVYDKSSEANVWKSVQNIVTDWEEYEPDQDPVPKAFVIRAMAMDNSGNKSDIVTATYFIDQADFANKNVISLVVSPDDLFGGEQGIYVTGNEYDEWYLNGKNGDEPTPHFQQGGKTWEREAIFELFNDSKSSMQQKVGIRIQGASARNAEEKRFSVYARKEYDGSDLLNISLFDNETQPHSVVLRNSLTDVIAQSLMQDRDIASQQGEPISLFLNGEYWYDSYIREKYSTQYFKDKYGIEKDNFVLYKGGFLEEGVETDQSLYNQLYAYAQTKDLSNDVEYELFGEMMDIPNYIDFLCSNIYMANMDVDDSKNVLMWRSRESNESLYNDGKWRFALYDMDALEWTSLNYYEVEEAAAVDSFSQQPRYADVPYNKGILYSALRQNEQFCKQFVLTFMDLLNTNFLVENVSAILEEYGEEITWFNSFFERRPEYMKKYLAKEFELIGSLETVILYNEDESKGTIQINTVVPAMENGNWSGEYYTDYPITVTANPAAGYEFIGWNGSVDSIEMTIEVPVTNGGIELRAEFQKVE